jgi:lysophospholipase L1-like esterase
MILKHTLLMLTFVTGWREFVTPGRRAFVGLLLAPLLCAGCVRQTATAGNRAAPLVYAAVGDSTGVGMGAREGGGYVQRLFARIRQERPGSTLLNLSAAGATTADALDKQLPRLDGSRAALVTVCVGVNDLQRGREAKEFAEDYEALVVKLRRPGRLLVLANLPDVTSAPLMKGMADEPLRTRLGQFNKAIEDVASRHGAPLVNLYKLSGETLKSRPEFFSSDGLHPSDLGYAHWAEAMWPAVARAVNGDDVEVSFGANPVSLI